MVKAYNFGGLLDAGQFYIYAMCTETAEKVSNHRQMSC